MKNGNATPQAPEESRQRRLIINVMFKVGMFLVASAVLFFLCAGRLDLILAWVYFTIVLASSVVTSFFMNQDLIAERSRVGTDYKRWDLIPALIIGRIGPLAILVVAGLDIRFGWSPPIALGVQYAALGVVAFGLAFTDWAVVTNQFFSSVVRIQKDRGHSVVSAGPYRFIRHPGYLGTIFFTIAEPLALGSLWGLLPAILVVFTTVFRTALEDRTLRNELEGYQAYAERVRFRLLPGVW
jgi:protein-S-isoprenylcysteine O-methyltransferase Ste14